MSCIVATTPLLSRKPITDVRMSLIRLYSLLRYLLHMNCIASRASGERITNSGQPFFRVSKYRERTWWVKGLELSKARLRVAISLGSIFKTSIHRLWTLRDPSSPEFCLPRLLVAVNIEDAHPRNGLALMGSVEREWQHSVQSAEWSITVVPVLRNNFVNPRQFAVLGIETMMYLNLWQLVTFYILLFRTVLR